ncbi:cellulose synthase A catalytic subunit 7 [Pyrus ussuriensis x Pyrus communis]|uniref:Cellulose synthase A catalytic subunit 7 n=1 Tax=Pyrus ussuriensis x Pyrus communis TaxID=2448454 RepID=A0A5N5FAL3_9ROSA|nr:cellulose synthase A catalytic subunit 7 [Pyrus ussuriensis x Pyrus communis]
MAMIYNLFEEDTVEEISFVDWNLPPIYDEYVDEDKVNNHLVNEVNEDGSEPSMLQMVSCDCYSSFGCYKNIANYYKHDANGDASNLQGMDDGKVLLMSQMNFENNFKQSTIFVTSKWMEQGSVPPFSSPVVMLKDAFHVISCGYEDTNEWGLELGWIYKFIIENILTGFKMDSSRWRSISIKNKELGPTTFERMGKWFFHEYFVAWNTLIAVNFILLLWLLWKNLQGRPKDRGRPNKTRGRVFFLEEENDVVQNN